MAAVSNRGLGVVVGAPNSKESEIVRVVYDFAVDGGATGALDLLQASGALIIEDASATVKTACTSGGSATVKSGPTADDDRFMTTTQGAVASLTANATILPVVVEGTPNVIACPYAVADGGKVTMTIGTAALTAGKIEFCFRVRKA